MNPPRESLVQYQSPTPKTSQIDTRLRNKSGQINNTDSKNSINDILNHIINPREWTANDQELVQYPSTVPSSRDDVATLQKLLDQRLVTRQARESGICPIRQELHNQCFDEIIRQVTIDCPQRGLLLKRVRDQLKMTISAYETLYQSSVTFGMRKQLQSEQGAPQLQQQVVQLTQTKQQLNQKCQQLKKKKELVQRQIKEKKVADDKKRLEEIEFLKYQANHLQGFLRSANEANK